MKKLVINLDATALGHSACIKDLYLTVVGELGDDGQCAGGYREKSTSANLVYGVAIHEYLNTCYKTRGDLGRATKQALKSFDVPKKDPSKTQTYLGDTKHLTSVGYNIWNDYCLADSSFSLLELMLPCWVCKGSGHSIAKREVPLTGDLETWDRVDCPNCKGQKSLLQPASEVTFSIKYWEDETIIINLCGTIDKIGKFHNGCYAIGDWKTTSAWDNDGYFQQYELSRQLRIYLLALRLMSHAHPESTLGKIGSQQVGCFIDAIFLNKEANKTEVKRSDVYQVSHSDLDAFQLTLDETIVRLVKAVKTGYLPKEGIMNGGCIKYQSITEKNFVKCMFWDGCRTNSQVERQLLRQNFRQWTHDPLKYNEL